jgi:hypothetical protein
MKKIFSAFVAFSFLAVAAPAFAGHEKTEETAGAKADQKSEKSADKEEKKADDKKSDEKVAK